MDHATKLYKPFLLLLISPLILACGEEPEKEVTAADLQALKEKPGTAADPAKKVVLTGTTDDPATFDYLNLLDFSNFGYAYSPGNESREVLNDSLTLSLNDIQSPRLMDVITFSGNRDTVPYFTRVFVTPGDRISMQVKNGEIEFKGKNEAHYNFFLQMNDPLRQGWAVYGGDPEKYKQQMEESYHRKAAFLEQYVAANPGVSEEFRSIVGEELKFEYLFNLMMPRNARDEDLGTTTNNKNNIIYVSALEGPDPENLFNAGNYFGDITIEDFRKPELINNDYFRRSLILYIRHYFAGQDYLEYSRKNFVAERDYIQKHLEGELETYAIGRLIHDYHEKGFGHGERDIQLLKDLIGEYRDQFNESSYAPRMNEIVSDLNAYNFKFPEEVLREKLLSVSGDTVSLQQILQKEGNRLKVIDFWASWCRPCLMEFKKAPEFKRSIAAEESLSFLYFSIDENEEDWRTVQQQFKEHLPADRQYLILDQKNSGILKQMLIMEGSGQTYFSIPRYSILDRDNSIISNNAPRPSDSLTFRKIIDGIDGPEN